MSLKDLESKYSEILGSTEGGPLVESSEQQPVSSSKDSAYKQPSYDGKDSDGVDPRDPSTRKNKADEQPDADEGEDEGEELNEKDGQSEDAEPSAGTEETEPIPDEYVQAGRTAGLSDDEIVDLAENNPAVLKKLVSVVAFKQSQFAEASPVKSQKGEDNEEGQQKVAAKSKGFEKLDVNVDDFDMDEDARNAFKKMQGGFNKMAEIIDELNARVETSEAQLNGVAGRQQVETRKRVDNFYDTASSEISVLGNISKAPLTAANISARNEIQKVAYAYQLAHKSTDEEALQVGLYALKGKLSKKELSQSLIQGLQKRKIVSTFRPGGRKEGETNLTSKQKAMKKMDEILGD